MKIAVYGAGAIGAFIGSRLAEAGHDVALIARGAHLHAIRANGLRVESDLFGAATYRLKATNDPSQIGPVDYLLLGVKAMSLTAIAPLCAPLLGPETAIVSCQNGLPWWYFHGIEGEADTRVEAVDPGGVIWQNLPPERVVGGIAYISSEIPEPGYVLHTEGNRFPMGEPSGGRTERAKAFSQALIEGGLKAPIRNDIRHELWVKLMGNAIYNPLSSLTRATMREMLDSSETYEIMRRAMDECRETAAAVGVQIAFSSEQRLEGSRAAGEHKTSMLQDLEAGKAPELEPITGAVLELAHKRHVPVPTLETVYAAAKLLFEIEAKQRKNAR
ncbi:MAG: 2-dehydropantoate 2-reductase [Acidobacteria bacterium]|nr:2-dehydropantoate 2-reductase [Acidobacteriota bacterium]